MLEFPGVPSTTAPKEHVALSCPKLAHAPGNAIPAAFAVLGPFRFNVTVAEVAPAGTFKLGGGFGRERVSGARVRLAVPVLDGSATEVAVKVTVTGVAAELAG